MIIYYVPNNAKYDEDETICILGMNLIKNIFIKNTNLNSLFKKNKNKFI